MAGQTKQGEVSILFDPKPFVRPMMEVQLPGFENFVAILTDTPTAPDNLQSKTPPVCPVNVRLIIPGLNLGCGLVSKTIRRTSRQARVN